MVGKVVVGRWLEGSFETRFFKLSSFYQETGLLQYFYAAILFDRTSHASFKIRGLAPSRPVDLDGSRLFIKADTCEGEIKGIWK